MAKKAGEKPGIGANGHFRMDLVSAEQRKNAEELSREHSSGMKETLRKGSESAARTAAKNTAINEADPSARKNVAMYVAKTKKLASAADSIKGEPESVGFEKIRNRRIAAVKRAALDVDKGGVRLPGHDKNLVGEQWYFDHHEPVRAEAHASAALSNQETPEAETASLSALRDGKDSVVQVHGKQFTLSSMPGSEVAKIAKGRSRIKPETVSGTPVDWDGIAKVSKDKNVAHAHEILNGRDPGMDPLSDPKRNAYAETKHAARPGTPEHMEYQLRAADVASTYRGDRMKGQTSLDITGLKHSNEGILSNKADTAQDSWIYTNSYGKGADAKAMGDQAFSKKVTKDKGVVSSNRDVGPASIMHAVNSHATQKAAEKIQKDLGMESTVPSTLVQETAWEVERRSTPKSTRFRKSTASADYNDARKQTAKQAKLAEAMARKKNWPVDKDGQLQGQKRLF